MQNKIFENQKIIWEKLENNIYISHFPSFEASKGFKNSQVYIKKYQAYKADSKKNVTIFLLHDIGQYHGRFNHLIDWTRENNPGVSFVALDFVGHGLSSGTRGHFEKFDHLVNDFSFLTNQLKKERAPGEKWIVLGHGMGGLVALDLFNRFQEIAEESIDGLILSNFILKFSSTFLQLEEQFIDGIKKFISHSRPYRASLGNDILSCPEAILSYQQDPLVVHRPTLNSIREIQKRVISIFQYSYFLDRPLMLLKSEKGSFAQGAGLDYFAKGIKKELLREKKYSLMKHDLYNELERVSVFKDIMDWIKIYEN